jgi:putative transposase
MLPSRKTVRLAQYDYSTPGAYFVTVCSYLKHCTFGNVRSGEFQRSSLGMLVADHLLKLPSYYSNLELDAWIVMPNHLHAVMLIHGRPVANTERPRANLGTTMGCFKSGVVREAKALSLATGNKVWNPRFHDHVIRHERALWRVREYITSNPRQWELDRDNDSRTGLNEFYDWIETYSQKVARSAS